jgi:hypothetical protein
MKPIVSKEVVEAAKIYATYLTYLPHAKYSCLPNHR